jgi:protein-tyrosine kinase
VIQEQFARHEGHAGGVGRGGNDGPNTGTQGAREHNFPPADLVRLRKAVLLREEVGTMVDGLLVAPQFYNCFNYALLSNGAQDVNIAVGVSSANPHEGKTLVACNLAVSLTVAHQRKTVLVDMNVGAPRLHDVFGLGIGPGLLEAVGDGAIHVAQTSIHDLFVLTAGTSDGRLAGGVRRAMDGAESIEPGLQLEQVAAFRDVLYSLKEQFSFVIVDMPAVREHLVPLLFTNQLDGVLFVVHGGQTRQGELDHAIQLVNERRILGFVYNGAERANARRRTSA